MATKATPRLRCAGSPREMPCRAECGVEIRTLAARLHQRLEGARAQIEAVRGELLTENPGDVAHRLLAL
jgi:hypothetical protein